MNTPITTACRCCRFYTPEGRRGGNCSQLGVSVRGCWQACAFALPPFAPSWEHNTDGITILQPTDIIVMENSVRVDAYSLDVQAIISDRQTVKFSTEEITAVIA
jgi:hypothetical protein